MILDYGIVSMTHANGSLIRRIVKTIILLLNPFFGLISFINDQKKKVDKTLNGRCLNNDALTCKVADVPFEQLSRNINRTPEFKIITDFYDIRNFRLENDEKLEEVLNNLNSSNDHKRIALNYCLEDSIDYNGYRTLAISDGRIYKDHVLLYARLSISEKEFIEYNFLYLDKEIVFRDCSTIYLL